MVIEPRELWSFFYSYAVSFSALKVEVGPESNFKTWVWFEIQVKMRTRIPRNSNNIK